MLLNASGYIDPKNIAVALSLVTKHYKPLTLPVCVDFDSVYDNKCASRFVPRSNVDNTIENTFYVTKIQQAITNQFKLNRLPEKGYFYALLPCLSLMLENSVNYSNNLVLEVIALGENKISEMVTLIKSIYLELGIGLNQFDFILSEDESEGIEVWLNGTCVGTVSCFKLPNDKVVTRASIIKEPIFTQSLNRTT